MITRIYNVVEDKIVLIAYDISKFHICYFNYFKYEPYYYGLSMGLSNRAYCVCEDRGIIHLQRRGG